jgi:hypothetical protein
MSAQVLVAPLKIKLNHEVWQFPKILEEHEQGALLMF